MAGMNPQIFRPEEPTQYPPQEALPQAVVDAGPAVPVGQVSAGIATQQGEAIRKEATDYIHPTWIESLGASFLNTDTANAARFITKPAFAKKANEPTAFDQMQQLPFVLSEGETELWQKEETAAGRRWLADRFQDARVMQKAQSAHPSANLFAQWTDPAYLATGVAFGQAARLARTATVARVGGGLAQGASAAVIAGAAAQVQPMTSAEYAANVLLNMAGGAMVSKEGRMVPKDPDYPDAALRDSLADFHADFVGPAPFGVETIVKPHYKAITEDGVTTMKPAGGTMIRRAADQPEVLRPGAPKADPKIVGAAVEQEAEAHAKSFGQKFGEIVEISLSKAFRKLGPKGEEIGDMLVDNLSKYTKTSAESIKRAVQVDLQGYQHGYEEALRAELARQGHGTWSLLKSGPQTRKAQAMLEADVAAELNRRFELHNQGKPIDHTNVAPHIKRLADAHDALMFRAADELNAGGVFGAEKLERTPGYFSRVWSSLKFDDLNAALRRTGLDEKAAHTESVKLLQRGLLKKNPNMTPDIAYGVAASIADRALRKGYLKDGAAGANLGAHTVAEIKDRLRALGIPQKDIDQVAKIVSGEVDEGGKAAFLKHRIDIDLNESMTVSGEVFRVADMLETNLSTLADRYVDKASGRIALSQKGMNTPSAISKAREDLIASVPPGDRKRAAYLFDNTVARILGNPVGEEMSQVLRNGQALNRMMALGASGLWQTTEYATQMAKYGFGKTLKYFMAELPVFKQIMTTDVLNKTTSRHLKDVLTNAAEQNLRLRPYIQRFEDNFDIPQDHRASLALQQGTQLVPYLNGMKMIHSHQARITSNLIIDSMRRAANGESKYVEMLKKYGLESHTMDKLAASVKQHGLEVDKWDDGVWAATRPTFIKMMDEAVLHQRMGDIPAFAQFDSVGKFVFTFRSFILSAHNKLLAGTAARDGMAGVSLLMMYQFPLAMMATQANSVVSGKGALSEEDLIKRSIGQMGSVGLFGELYNWAAGTKSEFGAPGLIPIDRGIKAGQSISGAVFGDGTAGKALQDSVAATPLVAITPGIKALSSLGD